VFKFSKNLDATTELWASDGSHEVSAILRIHKHYVPTCKNYSSRRPGDQALCIPDLLRVLTSFSHHQVRSNYEIGYFLGICL